MREVTIIIMKIRASLVNKQEVKLLCVVEVDELFCGNEPYNWKIGMEKGIFAFAGKIR